MGHKMTFVTKLAKPNTLFTAFQAVRGNPDRGGPNLPSKNPEGKGNETSLAFLGCTGENMIRMNRIKKKTAL